VATAALNSAAGWIAALTRFAFSSAKRMSAKERLLVISVAGFVTSRGVLDK
jgi:hypothetical protein